MLKRYAGLSRHTLGTCCLDVLHVAKALESFDAHAAKREVRGSAGSLKGGRFVRSIRGETAVVDPGGFTLGKASFSPGFINHDDKGGPVFSFSYARDEFGWSLGIDVMDSKVDFAAHEGRRLDGFRSGLVLSSSASA